ncbi:anaerobic ribonucleoside-triphosphate reductase activating protein [Gammaproteobacteria bacterium]
MKLENAGSPLIEPDEPVLWCYGLAAPVHSLGPGPRVGLWVTGCKRACHGCQSRALQSRQAGWPSPISRVAQRLLASDAGWRGLTLSGGEPFEQAPALMALLTLIKAARPHWNIIAFTGFRYQQLTTRTTCQALLSQVDLLIDGPFIENLVPRYPLTGSGNQQLLALTTEGQHLREQLMTTPLPLGEWARDHESSSFWIGFPPAKPLSDPDGEWWNT